MMMILAAFSQCQIMGIEALIMGYNADNKRGGYLDEGQEFMDKLSDMYYEYYGKEQNTEFPFNKKIHILNPFFDKEKWEMVKYGHSIGVDFSTTISCRQVQVGAGLIHCGECEVCKRRRASFIKAKVFDPTLWYPGSRVTDESFYAGCI